MHVYALLADNSIAIIHPSKLYRSCVNIIAGSILGSINDVFTFRLQKTDSTSSDTNHARYGHRTEYVFEQYEKFSHRGKQLDLKRCINAVDFINDDVVYGPVHAVRG